MSMKSYLLHFKEYVDEFLNPVYRKNNYHIKTSEGHEFSRIYHWHIRKNAGTGFNLRFMSTACNSNIDVAKNIKDSAHRSGGRAEYGGKVFVSWNKRILESGNYFYGSSHIPHHKLSLPQNTFTLTTLRDPLSRVFSHYKMIHEYRMKNTYHPCMRVEGKWLGDSKTLSEFVRNMPKEHLMAQLYHYSSSYSLEEACERLGTVNFVSRVEDLDVRGFNELNRIIPSLNFKPGKIRSISMPSNCISPGEVDDLRQLLDLEYRFLKFAQPLLA